MGSRKFHPEIENVFSLILSQKITMEDISSPVVFTANILNLFLGVIHADKLVKKDEIKKLNEIIEKLFSTSTRATKFARLVLKGIQDYKIYDRDDYCHILTFSLSESEKLLLIALGYEMSMSDGDIDQNEKKYLLKFAKKIGVSKRYSLTLESIFSCAKNMDYSVIGDMRILLNPSHFTQIDSLFVKTAQHILEYFPEEEVIVKNFGDDKKGGISEKHKILDDFKKKIDVLDQITYQLYGQINECVELSLLRNDFLDEVSKISHKIQAQEFRVAIVGEFSQGKSTFLNVLVGEEIQPTREIPCSGVLTLLKHGKNKQITCFYKDGRKELIGYSEYLEKASIDEDIALGNLSEGLKEIDVTQILFEHPSLEFCKSGILLIDSPGLNEHPDRTAITQNIIKDIDAVIFLTNALRPLTQGEQELLKDLLNEIKVDHEEIPENVFVLVNFCDLIRTPKGLEQVQKRVENLLLRQEQLIRGQNRIHFISAQGALEEKLANESNQYSQQFNVFTDALESFLVLERGKIKFDQFKALLRKTINKVIDDLTETEKILSGKINLSEEEKAEIVNNIGLIAGIYFKIQERGEEIALEANSIVTDSWNEWNQELRDRLLSKANFWHSRKSMLWDQEEVIKDYQNAFFLDLKSEIRDWEQDHFTPILKEKTSQFNVYVKNEIQQIKNNIDMENDFIKDSLSDCIDMTIKNIETEFVFGGTQVVAVALISGLVGFIFPPIGLLALFGGSSLASFGLGWFAQGHDNDKEVQLKIKVFQAGWGQFIKALDESIFDEIDNSIVDVFDNQLMSVKKVLLEVMIMHEELLKKQEKIHLENIEKRKQEQSMIESQKKRLAEILEDINYLKKSTN